MPSRRSHNKSRKGCSTCKQRRVKCDEQGPPCGACSARGTPCEYTPMPASSPAEKSTPAEAPVEEADYEKEIQFLNNNWILQVELMHHWSSYTFESFCRPTPRDREACRTGIPNVGMDHDFVLHAVLAAAAFDISSSVECGLLPRTAKSHEYLKAGFCHKYMSLHGFRAALANMDSNNHGALLHCAAILMVLSIASMQLPSQLSERLSAVDHILEHVQLMRGIDVVFEANPELLVEKDVMLQEYAPFEQLPEYEHDSETLKCLDSLSRWNDSRDIQTGPFELRRLAVSRKQACEKALFWLGEFMARCVDKSTYPYLLGWPDVADDEFLIAVRDRDHVALAILAFWGVAIERAATEAWWVRKVGTLLLEEITAIILPDAQAESAEIMAEIGRQLSMANVARPRKMKAPDDKAVKTPFSGMSQGAVSNSPILTRSMFGWRLDDRRVSRPTP